MSPVYIARVKEVAARSIGGEMMIMSARDSMLFSLNETATAIWQAADGATPLAEIVQRSVCARFEVDAARYNAALGFHGLTTVAPLKR